MIIFLYGQDSFRIDQKLKEIVLGYKAKNLIALNFILLDLNENNFEDLAGSLKSNSLIPEKKLVVVKNIFNTDEEKAIALLGAYNLIGNQETIFVAVNCGDFDNKNKLFQYLVKKPNLSLEFKMLSATQLRNWLVDFGKTLKIELDGEALNYMVENVGSDLWLQSQEIRKLADYKPGGIIRLVDVQNLINRKAAVDVFQLTDAIGAKNKKMALWLWHKSLESGGEPIEIFGLLAWHVRNLLKVKSAGSNARSLGLHPYVLEKTSRQARSFQVDDLKQLLIKLGESDLALKTGEANSKAVFLEFINCLG